MTDAMNAPMETQLSDLFMDKFPSRTAVPGDIAQGYLTKTRASNLSSCSLL
jgi:hypothetical protein